MVRSAENHTSRKGNGRGAAMIVALEVVFLIAALAAVLLQSVNTENLGTDALILDTQAGYLAESGAEYGIKQITQALASRTALPQAFLTDWTVDASQMRGYLPGYEPALAGAPPQPSVTWKVFQLEGAERLVNDSDDIDHAYQLYAVTAHAVVPDPKNPDRMMESYVNKIIDTDKIPLFQYLAFYSKYDLEIQPGPTATLTGRVHSNRDIYIGTNPGSTLTMITNHLRSAGALRRTRKDAPSSASNYYMTGNVRIKKKGVADTAPVNNTNFPLIGGRGQVLTPNYSVNVPNSAAPNGYDSSFGGHDANGDGDVTDAGDMKTFTEDSTPRWNGGVQTAAQGAQEVAAPEMQSLAAYTPPQAGKVATHKYNPATKTWDPAATGATHVPGHYQANAGLIVTSSGTRTKLLDSAGIVVHEIDTATGNVISSMLVDKDSGAAINPLKESAVFDRREYSSATDSATAGKVKVIDIDVAKLNKSKRNDTNQLIFRTDTNGLILYAYRTDTTATDPRGVRLYNGTELNNKLTFVSEDPVYIKGNFNTVNKKGAAIMCDATNLLSNEWNDGKTSSSGLPAPSTDLEINAAIVTGAYETLQNKYNGGFENFPRFHENWSGAGRSVKIRGSFVSLFESAFARNPWIYGGNYYTAPSRNWDFDKDLLKRENLPPGFPVSVSARRTVWWKGRDTAWWPF